MLELADITDLDPVAARRARASRVSGTIQFIGYPSGKGTEASEKVGGLQPVRNLLGLW